MSTISETGGDPRIVLLAGLYRGGVLTFEHTRWWASQLGLDRHGLRDLLTRCAQAHFGEDDVAA